MPETIAIRVSERTLERLRRGESVRVRLDRSNVVGGVARKPGRKPGKSSDRRTLWFSTGRLPRAGSVPARLLLWAIEHGGTVDSRQARAALRRGRVYSSGVLSLLAGAGLLRRVHWGRYEVTAKGRAARAELSHAGLYRNGCKSQQLAASTGRGERGPCGGLPLGTTMRGCAPLSRCSHVGMALPEPRTAVVGRPTAMSSFIAARSALSTSSRAASSDAKRATRLPPRGGRSQSEGFHEDRERPLTPVRNGVLESRV